MCNIQDVELVINYTFPLTIEEHMARAVGVGSSKAAQDYVHRIGRNRPSRQERRGPWRGPGQGCDLAALPRLGDLLLLSRVERGPR